MDIRKRALSAGRSIRNHVIYDKHERMGLQWAKENGNLTYRLNYDFLTKDSVVFDLGGYRGQWASDIFAKYDCTVYIFEPIQAYADFIKKKFERRKEKIKIFQFGLGDKSEERMIDVAEEGSSLYLGKGTMAIHLEDFMSFVEREGIAHIDLMKINIEGGEYDLLAYLIKTGYILHIRALQIQFHKFVPGAVEKMAAIRKDLEKTHVCDYHFEFNWDGWSLKPSSTK